MKIILQTSLINLHFCLNALLRMLIKMSVRHFPYQHPTFGTKLKPRSASYWQRSVYYWWFEYLRRHAGYKKTCMQSGKGKCAKLYADFGDIHSVEFKDWWTTDDRGAQLFAEPRAEHHVQVVSKISEEEAAYDEIIFVKVPLNFSKKILKRDFARLLAKHHFGERGHRYARESSAKYEVVGQPNINALRTTLQVYDYRKLHPELKLWEIARDLKLFHFEQMPQPDDLPETISDKKNLLAATVSRYLRKAETMIDNVGRGRFPDTKTG